MTDPILCCFSFVKPLGGYSQYSHSERAAFYSWYVLIPFSFTPLPFIHSIHLFDCYHPGRWRYIVIFIDYLLLGSDNLFNLIYILWWEGELWLVFGDSPPHTSWATRPAVGPRHSLLGGEHSWVLPLATSLAAFRVPCYGRWEMEEDIWHIL